MIELQVEQREVYGNKLYYPVNDKAKMFARLVGTKTLTPIAIFRARELGLTVKVVVTSNV